MAAFPIPAVIKKQSRKQETKMSQTLDKMLAHFRQVHVRDLVEAGKTVSENSWSSLSSVLDRVSESKAVTAISNLISSSADALRELVKKLKSRFKPEHWKLITGTVLVGVGGAALAESVGLAAALAISVLSVKVLACLLILWGLSIVLPTVWDVAKSRLEKSLTLN